jgi:hypothetical protein
MLDEMDDLLTFLRKNHSVARARAKLPVKDGYPTRSMPESDIAGGRTGDPTADYVVSLAGGKLDNQGMALDDDSWKGPHDPIGAFVSNMNREAMDARNRLRSSAGACRKALPLPVQDPAREQCVTCGVTKSIAGKWIPSTAQCGNCYERSRRRSPVK